MSDNRIDATKVLDAIDRHQYQDSVFTQFVSRQLTGLAETIYKTDKPALKARQFLPIISRPSGEQVYSFRTSTGIGEAKVTDDYANDSPNIEVSLGEDLTKHVTLRDHYNISVDDLRKAAYANMPLDSMKALEARDAIERKIDALLAVGDSNRGVKGFINHSAVDFDDVTGDPWADKTAEEVLADLSEAIGTLASETLEVEGQENSVDIIVPPSQFRYVAHKQMPNLGMSLLTWIRTQLPEIRSFNSWHYLTGAGDSASDRMVIYSKSPAKLAGLVNMELVVHPAERRALVWKTELEAKCGGVVLYKPKSVLYRDGI